VTLISATKEEENHQFDQGSTKNQQDQDGSLNRLVDINGIVL